MKTIGLLGGMSWESTIPYYAIINKAVKDWLGGLHSARLILYSVEFDEIERCQSSGDWEKSAKILGDAALRLERAGADLLVICTNTMHKVAPQIASMIHIPLVHIADATADALEQAQVRRVGLLGTRYTMTQDFYRQKLRDRGLEVLIPDEADVALVNDVIFRELCVGTVRAESRAQFQRIVAALKDRGAEGVILGCTEIGMLIGPDDVCLPVFDTTLIHAQRAAELALAGEDA